MDVLITGGNGLLGRHLAAALRDRGDDVRVLALPVSNDHPLTQQKVLEAIAHDIGVSPPVVHVPYCALYAVGVTAERLALLAGSQQPILTRLGVMLFGTDNRHAIDKARRELGYAPQVTIRDGIRMAAAWYRAQRERGSSSDALAHDCIA